MHNTSHMKLSVIIPVYKVEPYLERCVNSVLRQTFKDMEIIMVDDGSPDNSGKLAEQLATRDSRIKVIHQENQGLSGARNTGLRAAQGEYVIFLDSDDEWLLDDGIEKLFGSSPDGCEMIVFKHVELWPSGKVVPGKDYAVESLSSFRNPQEIFAHLVKIKHLTVTAWHVIVRRDFLIEHGIEFPVGLLAEDINWSLTIWQHLNTVVFHNIDLYCWNRREGSITTSLSIKMYQSYDKIFSHWEQECSKQDCKNRGSILTYMADLWTSLGYNYHKLINRERKEGLRILKAHKGFLDNATSNKARRAAKLVSMFGVKGAVILLGLYWRLRTIIKREVV